MLIKANSIENNNDYSIMITNVNSEEHLYCDTLLEAYKFFKSLMDNLDRKTPAVCYNNNYIIVFKYIVSIRLMKLNNEGIYDDFELTDEEVTNLEKEIKNGHYT